MKVLLDTGVLGLVTHPSKSKDAVKWMRELVGQGVEFVIPEICDYELRRKLLHLNSQKSLKNLDELATTLRYEAIDTEIWRKAAALWAECRAKGAALAPEEALDGDVLLIATTRQITDDQSVVVATTNVKHLENFVSAKLWTDISHPGA